MLDAIHQSSLRWFEEVNTTVIIILARLWYYWVTNANNRNIIVPVSIILSFPCHVHLPFSPCQSFHKIIYGYIRRGRCENPAATTCQLINQLYYCRSFSSSWGSIYHKELRFYIFYNTTCPWMIEIGFSWPMQKFTASCCDSFSPGLMNVMFLAGDGWGNRSFVKVMTE